MDDNRINLQRYSSPNESSPTFLSIAFFSFFLLFSALSLSCFASSTLAGLATGSTAFPSGPTSTLERLITSSHDLPLSDSSLTCLRLPPVEKLSEDSSFVGPALVATFVRGSERLSTLAVV